MERAKNLRVANPTHMARSVLPSFTTNALMRYAATCNLGQDYATSCAPLSNLLMRIVWKPWKAAAAFLNPTFGNQGACGGSRNSRKRAPRSEVLTTRVSKLANRAGGSQRAVMIKSVLIKVAVAEGWM